MRMGNVKEELNSSAATAEGSILLHTDGVKSVREQKRCSEWKQGVTYAEVVRKVVMQPNGSSVKMADRHEMRACEGCSRVKEDTLIVEKR